MMLFFPSRVCVKECALYRGAGGSANKGNCAPTEADPKTASNGTAAGPPDSGSEDVLLLLARPGLNLVIPSTVFHSEPGLHLKPADFHPEANVLTRTGKRKKKHP